MQWDLSLEASQHQIDLILRAQVCLPIPRGVVTWRALRSHDLLVEAPRPSGIVFDVIGNVGGLKPHGSLRFCVGYAAEF